MHTSSGSCKCHSGPTPGCTGHLVQGPAACTQHTAQRTAQHTAQRMMHATHVGLVGLALSCEVLRAGGDLAQQVAVAASMLTRLPGGYENIYT